ncbi:hypothetical protein B5807_01843 [Epicoccum nigrum]|uniref:Uncharacterized protein n=1 Tax=Epicoccum nigrum TaxID=105696 RepID=A0A1Y2MBH9_EPING|nr:hypothetical protein B5807_01843 [Epicoccum nigrum]
MAPSLAQNAVYSAAMRSNTPLPTHLGDDTMPGISHGNLPHLVMRGAVPRVCMQRHMTPFRSTATKQTPAAWLYLGQNSTLTFKAVPDVQTLGLQSLASW